MGVFNARISKGRTLREIALGQMLWCYLGCWVAMATLGNYGIRVQMEGIADIAGVLQTSGQPAAIVAILETMPLKKLMMGIVALLCFVFMATTVNSSAFVAAETTFVHKDSDSQAPRWCRVFWAAMICLITFVLLKVGGFNAVQVLALLIGLPLAILMFVVVASAVKAIIEDHGGKKNG
jgi:BCCT family betaine/carnitine transporter